MNGIYSTRLLCNSYNAELASLVRVLSKSGWLQGVGVGAMFGVMLGSYSLAFYYGSLRVRSGSLSAGFGSRNTVSDCKAHFSPSDVIICFFATVMGVMGIGQV